MANVTTTVTDGYKLEFNTTQDSANIFQIENATKRITKVDNLGSGRSYPGVLHSDDGIDYKLLSPNGVTFECTGTGQLAGWCSSGSTPQVSIDSNDNVDLTHNHLRLPIKTSLPTGASGQVIWFEDYPPAGRRLRLAIYLNGSWRFSSPLS